MRDRASVTVVGDQIVVQCAGQTTSLPLESTKRLRDQYSQAVSAHERDCGQCDLTYAYGRGSPDFDRDAARYTRDSDGRPIGTSGSRCTEASATS